MSPSQTCAKFKFCPNAASYFSSSPSGCPECVALVSDYQKMSHDAQRKIYDSIAKFVCRGLDKGQQSDIF